MKLCKSECPSVPIIRKCCFCVPIRKGVIIFAYINMVLTLLSLPPMMFDLAEQVTAGRPMGDQYMVELALTVAFLMVDVVMLSLLIVGAHKVLTLVSLPPMMFDLAEQVTAGRPMDDQYIIELALTVAFLMVDVVMLSLLIVGAHKKKRPLLKIFFYIGMIFLTISVGADILYFDYRAYVANTIYFFLLCLDLYLMFLVYNLIRIVEESFEVQYVAYQEGNQLAL